MARFRLPALLLLLAAGVVGMSLFFGERVGGSPAPTRFDLVAPGESAPELPPSPPPPISHEREREPAGAPPIPVVAREVGNLVLKGTVRDDDRGLVPGSEVRLQLIVGDAEPFPLPGIPAPGGTFATEIEVPRHRIDGTGAVAVLEAVAHAPLHHRSRSFRLDLVTADRSANLDLIVTRGATLCGRVLDAEGVPVSGALVRASRLPRGEEDRVRSENDGRYELAIRRGGLHEVHAVHRALGKSSFATLELSPEHDSRAPDLVLRAGATIAGTTRYPDARLAARVSLVALPERAVGDGSLDRLLDGLDPLDDPSLRHLSYGLVQSDGDGHFRFEGLQRGRYFLVVDEPGYKPQTTLELFDTGEDGAEVPVDLHRVRLRTVDPRGRPIQGARYSYSIGIENESIGSSGWTSWPDGTEFLWGTSFTRPGSTAFVRAWIPSCGPQEVTRAIAAEGYETRLELVLGNDAPPGSVRLEVVGSDGKPPNSYTATLYAERNVIRLHEFRRAGGDTTALQLPPGRYQLAVSVEEFPLRYFTEVEEFELAAGEETAVRVELPIAGSLQIVVHRPEGDPRLSLQDLRLTPVGRGEQGPRGDVDSPLSYRLLGALRDHCREHSGESDPYAIPSLQLLRPGTFQVRVELADCQPIERTVEIREGVTTELELWPVAK